MTESLMQNVLAQLRRPFVREAGVLQIGLLVRIGVGFLVSIALARLLGLENYGAYALVAATVTTISLFKRLGQDYVATTSLATAYARQDAKAGRETLAIFNAVNLWSILLVVPPALLLAPIISGWFFDDTSLAQPLQLALLPSIWAPLLATLVIALQCSRRLVTLTAVENADYLALAVSGLILVAVGRGVSGYFLGQAAASLAFALVAAAIYQRVSLRDPLLPPWRDLARGLAQPGPNLWREFRSGLAVALDKNLVSLYPLAPILLLGALASTEQVALLRVALTYLAAPLLALGAVSRLLMVKLPDLQATQPERMRRFFFQVTTASGGISILITLPFLLLAPWLIELLYGPDFRGAARLVPLLALDPLLAGFSIAAGPIFRTYRRNTWALYANLTVLLLGLPLAYLLIGQDATGGDAAALERAALAYAGLVTAGRLISYALCVRIVSSGQNRT